MSWNQARQEKNTDHSAFFANIVEDIEALPELPELPKISGFWLIIPKWTLSFYADCIFESSAMNDHHKAVCVRTSAVTRAGNLPQIRCISCMVSTAPCSPQPNRVYLIPWKLSAHLCLILGSLSYIDFKRKHTSHVRGQFHTYFHMPQKWVLQ